jgi:hypothetical protein
MPKCACLLRPDRAQRGAVGRRQLFPPWRRALRVGARLAREPRIPPCVLRTTGFLRREHAEWIAAWYIGEPTAPADAVDVSYRALEHETARLYETVCRAGSLGGLGVRVRQGPNPYAGAADLCADLRDHRSITVTTFGMVARNRPHRRLGGEEAGLLDQLRVVHDVLGHAALGMGFDLQSEFATWLQCRTLYSKDARRALFCELVGPVMTYVTTGRQPALHADLPPAELVAACEADARAHRRWRTSDC